MIKEKKRVSKYTYNKTSKQLMTEYLRTVGISFCFAFIFTIVLAYHARCEMIKDLYSNQEEKSKLEEQMARRLVEQSDLMKDLQSQSYAVCMHVGYLYETVHDYPKAQYAYELALRKAASDNYTPSFKLIGVLIAQEQFKEANALLDSITDSHNKKLVKLKSRSYIIMGDKYYSLGKFISAGKCYEKAKFYYDRFKIKDKVVEKSIEIRIVNAYIKAADVMAQSGKNTDAVRFLKKAEKYDATNFNIRYKLAIVYSDLDPVKSTEYFESLLLEQPQNIDYGTYCKALMKAGNIADLKGDATQAKYYRYKIHSVDLFIDRKVIYKNDIDVNLDSFRVRKFLFKYKVKPTYIFVNRSNTNINKLSADFVLRNRDKEVERVTKTNINSKILYSNGGATEPVSVVFGKNIFTKKELENYEIDIYLYKDEKYKTLVNTIKVPRRTIKHGSV